MSLSRRSGTLQLTTPNETGEIVFRAGKVVAAFRSALSHSVGEALLAANVVSPMTFQEMLAAQKAGKRPPELFTAFKVDSEAMAQAFEEMLRQIIYSMFDWSEGTFSFVLEDSTDLWRGFALDGQRVIAENGLNPQFLAMEGTRLRDERNKDDTLASFLKRSQPGSSPAPAPAPAPAASAPAGGLSMQQIAARLRSATDLDALAGLGDPTDSSGPAPAALMAAVAGSAGSASYAQPDSSPDLSRDPLADDNVIPFPAKHARSGAAEPVVAPAPALPAPSPSAPAAPVAAALAAPAVMSAGALAARRLLAVDDDPQVTRYIQAAFGPRFGSVAVADTVKDALAALEADPHNVVIATDLIIARSDGRGILGGIEILERIRQKWADLPVVLFTDYQNEEAEARARSMGALDVVLKPRKAQVQAAAREGGSSPLAEFLRGLERSLAPYYATQGGPLDTASVIASAGDAATSSPAAAAESFAPVTAPIPAAAVESFAAVALTTPILSPPPAAPAGSVSPGSRGAGAGSGQQYGSYDLGAEMAQEISALGGPSEEELPPVMLSGGEMGALRSMLAELIDPSNRDTITLLVLRFASNIVERAGLFLSTRRAYVGLGGFSIDEPSDKFVLRVRKIQVPVEADSVFSKVTHYRSMVRGPLKETDGNRHLVESLGGKWPGEAGAVVAPLISGDRVAAILYGDNPSGKPLGAVDGLEIFLQQAGLAMDRALLERRLEDKKKQGAE